MTCTLPSRPTGSFGSPRGGSRSGLPPWPDSPRDAGARRRLSLLTSRRTASMAASPKVYISGKLYDKADAKISVFDHGLLYGDGVFEGIRAYAGRVLRLVHHVNRLFESAKGIRLNIPLTA